VAFETLIWVRKQKTGNVASRSVLRVLADHAGQDHSCYLRTATIADETDLSEAGVRKALARLIEAGLVRVFERYSNSGARRSNRYQILVDGADTPPPDAEDWAGIRQGTPRNEGEDPRSEGGGAPLNEGEGFPSKEAPVVEASLVKAPAAQSRATRITEDYIPDERMRAWFAAENLHHVVDIRTEHAKFVDYFIAAPGERGRKLDWPATWRNWMRTAAERAGRRPGTALAPTSGAPYRPSTTDQKVAQTLELGRRLQQQMEESA